MAEYAEGNLSPGELGRRGQEADKRRTRVAYLPVDLGGGLGVLGAYYISLREKSFDVQDLATTHDTLHTHTHTHPLITKTVTCLSRRPLKKKKCPPVCVAPRQRAGALGSAHRGTDKTLQERGKTQFLQSSQFRQVPWRMCQDEGRCGCGKNIPVGNKKVCSHALFFKLLFVCG